MILKKIYIIIGWIVVYSQYTAHAQTPPQAPTTILQDNSNNTCLMRGDCHLSDIPITILGIANYLVGISGTISVIMVMWGGYQWIMGGVSEDQKGKGKKTLMYAIIGLILSLLSWVIVNVIQVNITS